MRLKTPRIAPVDLGALTEEQTEALAPLRNGAPTGTGAPVLNIFLTLAQDPVALKAFLAWGQYVMSRRSGLAVRERELVILRVGFLCRAGYEWTQHAKIGLRAGLAAAELQMIKEGPTAVGWSAVDVLLLRAADALVADHFIGEDLWTDLGAVFSPKACTDLVFTVGQYVQVSMILNTLGVQLEDGQTLDPDLDFR